MHPFHPACLARPAHYRACRCCCSPSPLPLHAGTACRSTCPLWLRSFTSFEKTRGRAAPRTTGLPSCKARLRAVLALGRPPELLAARWGPQHPSSGLEGWKPLTQPALPPCVFALSCRDLGPARQPLLHRHWLQQGWAGLSAERQGWRWQALGSMPAAAAARLTPSCPPPSAASRHALHLAPCSLHERGLLRNVCPRPWLQSKGHHRLAPRPRLRRVHGLRGRGAFSLWVFWGRPMGQAPDETPGVLCLPLCMPETGCSHEPSRPLPPCPAADCAAAAAAARPRGHGPGGVRGAKPGQLRDAGHHAGAVSLVGQGQERAVVRALVLLCLVVVSAQGSGCELGEGLGLHCSNHLYSHCLICFPLQAPGERGGEQLEQPDGHLPALRGRQRGVRLRRARRGAGRALPHRALPPSACWGLLCALCPAAPAVPCCACCLPASTASPRAPRSPPTRPPTHLALPRLLRLNGWQGSDVVPLATHPPTHPLTLFHDCLNCRAATWCRCGAWTTCWRCTACSTWMYSRLTRKVGGYGRRRSTWGGNRAASPQLLAGEFCTPHLAHPLCRL